jgi:hypothetical protein
MGLGVLNMFIIQVKHHTNAGKVWHVDVEKTIPYTYYLSTHNAFKFETRQLAEYAVNILTDNNLYPKQLYSFDIQLVIDDELFNSVNTETKQEQIDG